MQNNRKNDFYHVPMLSVIMGVFNGEPFLNESIDSILGQSFTDFEFLIVDDRSSDNSISIIEEYTDSRIRLVKNYYNIGLASSLNKALSLARGSYIARMDADDVCLPERFEKQLLFLEENPHVGGCGCWMRTVGEEKGQIFKYPITSSAIRCRLLFDSPLSHPTLMARREILESLGKVYDPMFSPAEDFDLWTRLSCVTNLANIGEVMLLYRQHSDQVTKRDQEEQSFSRREVYKRLIDRLGLVVSSETLSLHEMFHDLQFPPSREKLLLGENWLHRLMEGNNEKGFCDAPALRRECAYRWFRLCDAATAMGSLAWRVYWASPLAGDGILPVRQRMRFALKCALRWQTQGRGGMFKRVGRLSPLFPGKGADS